MSAVADAIDSRPAGRGAQMTERLRTEIRAGTNLADVAISGPNPMFVVKKMGDSDGKH